jgi:hypothetical protein
MVLFIANDSPKRSKTETPYQANPLTIQFQLQATRILEWQNEKCARQITETIEAEEFLT